MIPELKELIKSIKVLTAAASVDVSGLPWATRAGAEANVRNAQEELKLAKQQYQGAVASHSLTIGVVGPYAKDFARISRDKLKTLAVDFSGLDTVLLERIQKRGAQESFGTFENTLLMGEVLSLKTELGIVTLPPIQENASGKFFFQPTAQSVGNVIRANYRNALNTIYLRRQVEQQALESMFDGKVLPVVLYNYDGSLGIDPEFLPVPVAVIEANAPLSIEKVKKELLKVKASLQPAKPVAAPQVESPAETEPQEDNQEMNQENPNV